MTRHDMISGLFNIIKNNEFVGNRECVYSASKKIAAILKVLQKYSYIGEFEYIEDGRGGKFKIQLLGRINNCGSIKPHLSVKIDKLEEWEKQYLPARDIGILILTTPKGIMSHIEAKKFRIGGRLLGYVY